MNLNTEAIDNQLAAARKQMLEFAEDNVVSEEVAMALMRLAYGKGYLDAVKEEDRETRARMAEALGLLDRATGEIHG